MATDENQTDKKLRRLRALLDRANHPATPVEEAKTAREAAERLMIQLSLSEAAVNATRNDRAKPVSETFDLNCSYAIQNVNLFAWIADVFNVRMVRRTQTHEVIAIGFQSDIDIAWTLYDSLHNQMMTEMGSGSASYKRSFMTSFASRVSDRLKKMYTEESESSGSTALVLSRKDEVEAEYARRFPSARRGRSATINNLEGMLNGRSAADRADIHLPGARFDSRERASISA